MYRITFVLNLFKGEEDRELSHATLRAMLLALMHIDMLYLRAHPEVPLLFKSGVRYAEEPPGQEDWQDIPTTLKLGWGDCEDLACWRAAELRVRHGIQAEPTFIWKLRPNGGYLYHILVKYPDGRIEDPSRTLGMR
jgi:hypothetical protein